jgi:N-methylhydantoinase A
MEKEAASLMAEAKVEPGRVTLERVVEARYEGQGHEVEVSMDGLALDDSLRTTLSQRFEERHVYRFGHSMQVSLETVTFRLRAFGAMTKLAIRDIAIGSSNAEAALVRNRLIHLAGQRRDCAIYERSKLLAGNVIHGPAIVEEPAHVTLIFPGDILRVDAYGNLVVTIGADS